jgi:hypothetical protein
MEVYHSVIFSDFEKQYTIVPIFMILLRKLYSVQDSGEL